MLNEAWTLAAEAMDPELAFVAVGELAKSFEAKPEDYRAKVFDKARASRKSGDNPRELSEVYLRLAGRAFSSDDYDDAIALAKESMNSRTLVNPGSHPDLVADAQALVVEAAETRKEYDKYMAAGNKLTESPNDTAANLERGRFLFFYKGDWTQGLPLLARGSDTVLKTAAQAELNGGTTPTAKVGIADAWVQTLPKYARFRQQVIDRASTFYGEAWPNLDDSQKAKLRTRLTQLYSAATLQKPKSFPTLGWNAAGVELPAPKTEMTSNRVHSGSFAMRFEIKRQGGLAEVGSSEPFKVRPGKEIEVSAWVLSDRNDVLGDSAFIRLYDDQGKEVFAKFFAVPVDKPIWTRISTKAPFPVGAVTGKVGFLLASRTGELFYDDFSLKVDGKEVVPNGGFEGK
jgi:hypothetical protein